MLRVRIIRVRIRLTFTGGVRYNLRVDISETREGRKREKVSQKRESELQK